MKAKDKLIEKLKELINVFDDMIDWDNYRPSTSERQRLTGCQSEIATLEKQVEEQESITDEEIKNYFTKEHFHYQKGRYTRVDKDRIFGAKFMRDHPEQFKIKTE